jgi:hypothetical protein
MLGTVHPTTLCHIPEDWNLQQHLYENLMSYITHNLFTAHVFVAGPKTIFFWAPAFKWVSDCVKNSYLCQGWCYLCYMVSQCKIPQPKCSCHSMHRIATVSVTSELSYRTRGNASEVSTSSSPGII